MLAKSSTWLLQVQKNLKIEGVLNHILSLDVQYKLIPSVFTAGSKTEVANGSSIFSDNLDSSMSQRLPKKCRIFKRKFMQGEEIRLH